MPRLKKSNDKPLSTMFKPNAIFDDTSTIKLDKDVIDSSKGLFKSTTLNGNSIMQILSHKTTLQRAKYNFLYNVYNETERTIFRPLEIFKSDQDDIANEIYNISVEGSTDFSFKSIATRTLSLSLKQQAIDSYFKKMLVDGLSKSLQPWFGDEWTKAVSVIKSNFMSNINDKLQYIPYVKKLAELKDLMNDLDFELHHGYAGSGKSSSIVKALQNETNINSNNTNIISLSNTICLMFKQKCPQIGFSSISKARFLYNLGKGLKDNKFIILDEFSQWGFESLDVLIDVIKNNKKAKFYIMGDLNQIPTFLSSGSLLYSIIDSWPKKCIQHNNMYRFKCAPALGNDIVNILNKKFTFNINDMSNNSINIDNINCVICGTNSNVELMNKLMLMLRHNVFLNETEKVVATTELLDSNPTIPLIANKTTDFNQSPYKVYCNERFRFESFNQYSNTCILRSEIDNRSVCISKYNLMYDFNIAYAITVNKAQGLEWEQVIVYVTKKDLNLLKFNPLYVAMTRGKSAVFVTTSDDNNKVEKLNLIKCLYINYKFMNNFNEIK